ncbi:MAG: hypothetical protein MUE60_04515 [Candidatus Eisenbacteria bacterium]|nr:hypothetical protein [Candidatus Eisenbacteria bacterium]
MVHHPAMTRRDTLVLVLIAGSLWGLSEVALNAGLRFLIPDLRATGLVASGMFLMGMLLGTGRSPVVVPAAALIAVACRQLVVPILQTSPLCKANACIAVTLQAASVAGAAAVLGRRIHHRPAMQAVVAGAGALVAAVSFHTVGLHVAPCAYLQSFGQPGGLVVFLGREGIAWATAAALAMPVGYSWGHRLAHPLTRVRAISAPLYYASSLALVAGCWIACGLMTAAGH